MATTWGTGVLDDILLSTTPATASISVLPSDEVSVDDDTSTASSIKRAASKRQRALSHGGGSSDATDSTAPNQVDVGTTVNQKIDTLMAMMNDIAPVVKTLKEAYEDALLGGSQSDDDEVDGPPAKQMKTATTATVASLGVVDSLVSEINTEEKTGPAISGKIAKALDSILSTGLNEKIAAKRKENIDRPENCKLLTTTRVNPEIWDIAKKQTRSMDARFQQLQETLMKGLVPLANMAGKVGEAIDSASDIPPNEELWEALSNASILVALANHDLNICRRDMFKTDLDEDYKALCNNKHPVGSQLFGDDFSERLKTVTETNKASKQLTGSKTGPKTKASSRPFFSQGGHYQRPRTPFFRKSYQKGYRTDNKRFYPKIKKDNKATKQ